MVTLRGIVDNILRKYGYEPIEREGIIEGELAGKRINIGIADDETDIGDVVSKLLSREGAHVIACVADMDANERKMLEGRGLVIWDKRSIEEELGAAVVTHLEANRGGLFELLAVRDVGSVAPQGMLPVLIESESGERILKPIVSFEDVKEISSKTIGGYKFDLELVPYYFYEYFCIMKVSGIESPDKRTGTIGVNALTGDAQPWSQFGEVIKDIGQPHINLEPKVEARDAEKAAMSRIVSLHTEEVERVVEKGHARIVDKMVVKPEEADITLESRGMISVPMWCVEGLKGVMVLNATTGKVVSEEYYTSPKTA